MILLQQTMTCTVIANNNITTRKDIIAASDNIITANDDTIVSRYIMPIPI